MTPEDIDTFVAAEMRELEHRLSIEPGHCWSCTQPVEGVTHVVFPGENLLRPGGCEVVFHMKCWQHGILYDQRWVSAVPGRTSRYLAPRTGTGQDS